ncbi:MAG TPA: carbohydrate binding domain-containing protein [Candidatus Limnocylindrales bacterium]|nr:carbohydrate binding domain-containing protein [Candidatus Limnocylindrales bacterium]
MTGRPEDAPGGVDRRPEPGPESLAAILSILVVLALGIVLALPPVTTGEVPSASGSPQPSRTSGATNEPLDVTQARFALTVVERLVDDRADLAGLARASTLDTVSAAATIRRIAADARVASEMAAQLARSPRTARFAARLTSVTTAALAEATSVLELSPTSNATAYGRSTNRLLTILDPLRALAGDLTAYVAEGSGASPQASVTPSVAGSGAPSPEPGRSASASPSAPAGSAAPSSPPGELLVDGSFELTTGGSWQIATVPPAIATSDADTDNPADGKRAARISISVGTDERDGVSVSQGGLDLLAGRTYRAAVSLRAAAAREVRVRIVSANGTATYATRVAIVGRTWTRLEFDFTSFVEDPAAAFEIDLGRSTATTWIDAASLAPAPD